jgi:hypothetical protein
MGLKAHQMDVETPARGRDRSKDLHWGRGGRSTRGNLAGMYPGGLCPFHQNVGLGRPMTSPKTLYDIIQHCGGFGRAIVARVAASGGLRGPNVLLQEANVALERANVTLKGHGILIFFIEGLILTFNVKQYYYVFLSMSTFCDLKIN